MSEMGSKEGEMTGGQLSEDIKGTVQMVSVLYRNPF